MLKVGYIDDEPALCETFKDNFEDDHIEIAAYSNPQEGIEQMAAFKPDIIFLDYRLPDMTGDDIAEQLDPAIPKFLITGDLFVKTRYPFVKIFGKPYDFDELEDLLAAYAAKTRA